MPQQKHNNPGPVCPHCGTKATAYLGHERCNDPQDEFVPKDDGSPGFKGFKRTFKCGAAYYRSATGKMDWEQTQPCQAARVTMPEGLDLDKEAAAMKAETRAELGLDPEEQPVTAPTDHKGTASPPKGNI